MTATQNLNSSVVCKVHKIFYLFYLHQFCLYTLELINFRKFHFENIMNLIEHCKP